MTTPTTTVPTEPTEAMATKVAALVRKLAVPVSVDPDEVYFDNGHARQVIALLAAAPVPSPHGNAWKPISEHTTFGLNNSVIVAVPYDNKGERTYIVGEAYRIEPKGDAEPDWWWANTGPGDYTGDPIGSMGYGAPTLFQPLPVAPSEGVEP